MREVKQEKTFYNVMQHQKTQALGGVLYLARVSRMNKMPIPSPNRQ